MINSCTRHEIREKTMTEFLIITGTRNSGKTTTAGMVYKRLLPQAKIVMLTDAYGRELPNNHPLLEDEVPIDFIAYLEIKGKKIAIVSIGDYPQYLEQRIESYIDKVDFFVCCLRTHNREGSARKMLLSKYANYPRKEFRTVHSEGEAQMFSIKDKVVEEIVSVIVPN